MQKQSVQHIIIAEKAGFVNAFLKKAKFSRAFVHETVAGFREKMLQADRDTVSSLMRDNGCRKTQECAAQIAFLHGKAWIGVF